MDALLSFFFFALGALCGSFSGVVAERAFTGQSWKTGRSKCNSCREVLSARDLVPIVSWLMHRGRCRRCGSNVPFVYALYELSLGMAFLGAFLHFGLTLNLALFLLALLPLAFIVIYDLRHTLVPPQASLVFIACSALFAVVQPGGTHTLLITLAFATGTALFFFLLYALSRGRAMGLGDTPVSFGLGLLAGHASLAGLLFSFWIGGVIGIYILASRRGGPRMGIEVPFVPFLAAGFLLAILTQWTPFPY